MGSKDVPTCEYGFWEPLHAGCPQCGPHGPCPNPEYEALIQKNLRSKERRRTIFRLIVGFLAGALVVAAILASPARAERVGVVCREVVLPLVIHCSTDATLKNGYTDAACIRT